MANRSIILIVTAAEDGAVIIQPAAGGSPSVVSGELGKRLHELASDATLPEYKPEPGITGRGVAEGVLAFFAKQGAASNGGG